MLVFPSVKRDNNCKRRFLPCGEHPDGDASAEPRWDPAAAAPFRAHSQPAEPCSTCAPPCRQLLCLTHLALIPPCPARPCPAVLPAAAAEAVMQRGRSPPQSTGRTRCPCRPGWGWRRGRRRLCGTQPPARPQPGRRSALAVAVAQQQQEEGASPCSAAGPPPLSEQPASALGSRSGSRWSMPSRRRKCGGGRQRQGSGRAAASPAAARPVPAALVAAAAWTQIPPPPAAAAGCGAAAATAARRPCR